MDVGTVISGAVAFVSLLFAGYQTYQAKENKETLDETKRKLSVLEDGIATSDLKLRKAKEYYSVGKFNECLNAATGYIHDSEDSNEVDKLIRTIFWQESKKIYSEYMGKRCSIQLLAVIALMKDNDKESETEKYPDFIIKLIETSAKKYNKSYGYYMSIIYINKGMKEELIKSGHLDDIIFVCQLESASESFRDALKKCCEKSNNIAI
jgi:hypothetical protein